MSRNTPRARIADLTEELAIGAALRLRCNSDDIHDVVKAVVDYLVTEYPSQDLYIPAGSVKYPIDEIRAAIAAQNTVRSICRTFRISPKTLYRIIEENEIPLG